MTTEEINKLGTNYVFSRSVTFIVIPLILVTLLILSLMIFDYLDATIGMLLIALGVILMIAGPIGAMTYQIVTRRYNTPALQEAYRSQNQLLERLENKMSFYQKVINGEETMFEDLYYTPKTSRALSSKEKEEKVMADYMELKRKILIQGIESFPKDTQQAFQEAEKATEEYQRSRKEFEQQVHEYNKRVEKDTKLIATNTCLKLKSNVIEVHKKIEEMEEYSRKHKIPLS